MSFLQITTTVLGICMSLGYFPQAYKMYKDKSSFNVSVMTFSVFAIGTTLWTVYGFTIHDMTLILSFIPGVLGSWLVLFFTFYYKPEKK